MSCCGRKRQDLRPMPAPDLRPRVAFEYTGNTAMAVIGAVSRLRYTFIKPGARVDVDPRDRTSLAAVPHLRQV
jgi:hypothetical protein